MKVAFAGTPDFAAAALAAILDAGFEVPLVLTQPDRPAGRGLKLQPSAVKTCAQSAGIAVIQPRGLRLDGKWADDAQQARRALEQAAPDVLVVAAYGLILPRWVLEGPRHGCLNIHASLLPRWRGAAPIHRAIEAGDAQTGITIMQMDEGLDTGDMILREAQVIEPGDTTASLLGRLALQGGALVVQALRGLESGGLTRTPQPLEGVTYAHKIAKSEASIDWSLPARALVDRIRAFDPFPGVLLFDGQEPVKVWEARVARATVTPSTAGPAEDPPPGRVLAITAEAVQVACGRGECVELRVLQRASGRRLPAPAVAQALGWHTGLDLTAPPVPGPSA